MKEKPDVMGSVKPYLDQLLEAARHDLKYHEHRGDLQPGDLTPEEVVGELLIAANSGWEKRPGSVSTRMWLFRLEDKVMHDLITREEDNRSRWEFSMEEPVPDLPTPFSDDTYWDWNQPDEGDRWEDAIFGFDPMGEELIEEAEEVSRELEPKERRAWLLFEKYDFTIPEIAGIINLPAGKVAEMVRDAGDTLRERLDEKAGSDL